MTKKIICALKDSLMHCMFYSGSKAYGADVLFHIEKEPAIEAPVSRDDQGLMSVMHS